MTDGKGRLEKRRPDWEPGGAKTEQSGREVIMGMNAGGLDHHTLRPRRSKTAAFKENI